MNNNSNCRLHENDNFLQKNRKAEKRTFIVSVITLITMIIEITYGLLTGSMALLADGIHMGTHAFALFITLGAYVLSRKLHNNQAFSFGTGKIGVLGGYTNALLLGATAFFMIFESAKRLIDPHKIDFNSAIMVAVIGLTVNLICAVILSGAHSHNHSHKSHNHSAHEKGSAPIHKDANLRGAIAHVITDAFTSVLAIGALLLGKHAGYDFLDPAAGFLGSVLILKWSYHLIKDSGSVLLDFGDFQEELAQIRKRLESEGVSIRDIHLWRYSENDRALMITIADLNMRDANYFRSRISDLVHIDHITIEVQK
ncbi:MAG: CDF family Co(II)/Ni(II) efflux transporter DmeF [Spirochaetes bacterium]|nr:CDF family Co(II)/Ni(II) efflux transporter DmeF [Spirochaetota bacterium]MBN2772436.1 CDF family Co(II)/Ni(II) efflux transporter DmeF [Spirochaetota bacterium]